MATSSTEPAHVGPVHVDEKIVKEVLSAATGDTIAKKQTKRMQNWCKFIVQSPHHKGGYAITPTAASGLAAFYSATAKFVTLLASLPHGGGWEDYKCAEWRSQDPAVEIRAPAAPAANQVPQVITVLLIPPLNQLAQMPAARAHGENAENAQEGRGLRMPDQRRITCEIMRGWAPHSDARENGVPQPQAMTLHQRHATQTFDCSSRTLEGQPGHSRCTYKSQCLMKKNSIARPTSAKRSPGRQTLFSALSVTTRASLLRRASIRRMCIRNGPPTTANTWGCPSRTSPSYKITNAHANASR
jgi:hypothetical protein